MKKLIVPASLQKLAERITQAGGTCMLVGGAVVDLLQHRTPKDWDIEVYGKSYEDLVEILKDYSPKTCGKTFGVIKLAKTACGGFDVDVNVPRRDNNTGVGHKDFNILMDPTMTSKEAAMRRDFTINSLYYDMNDKCIVDHFGGLRDLEQGILRATDPATFVEDPLRALRAMQLLPRKAKTVDPATFALIRGMVDSFPSLSNERVYEEWRKLLLKAPEPSVGLEFLRESGWIKWFPELEALVGCGQHPEWHPEGDVWTHTKLVADAAAWARDKVDPDWKEAFVFGAFLHDVGKPATTVFPHLVEAGEFPKERLWTAWGHDRKGMDPAASFMARLTNNKKLTERVVTIVGEHMQPFNLHQGEAKASSWKRLHNKIRLDIIGWMSRCDSCGGYHRKIGDPDLDHEVSESTWAHYDDMGGPEPVKAILQGRHLIAAGYKPGASFGKALAVAYEAQIDNPALSESELLQVAVRHL